MNSVFTDFDQIIESGKKYKIIYADPPWSYENKKLGRSLNAGAEIHYDTMSLEEIKNLPIHKIRDRDSAIFLWVVVPQLPECFEVLKSWGFEYKTMITWVKSKGNHIHGGLGYWFRGYTEHLLFGIRGNVKAFKCQKKNYIIHTNMGHSKKPDEFRKLVEVSTYNLTPRIELFARTRIHGWDVFGNDHKLKLQPLESF